MDHIIQALERAKTPASPPAAKPVAPRTAPVAAAVPEGRRVSVSDVEINVARLEGMHVVAHDAGDPRSMSFDLLRTQLLQAMDTNNWRVVAITSPTPACGKTFMAVNLILSIARQPDRTALLIDLDLRKPQVAKRLGIDAKTGLRSYLEGRSTMNEAILNASVGGLNVRLLPTERPSSRSSDWMGSRAMTDLFGQVRNDDYKTVILDLPPLLSGDDALSVLPHVDCVLMVAAAGMTTASELKECANFLKQTPVVRVVLNKAAEAPPSYY